MFRKGKNDEDDDGDEYDDDDDMTMTATSLYQKPRQLHRNLFGHIDILTFVVLKIIIKEKPKTNIKRKQAILFENKSKKYFFACPMANGPMGGSQAHGP